MSSFNNLVRLDSDNLNMFTEQEVLKLIRRLAGYFAKLQRAGIAHCNIKPANLVFRSRAGSRSSLDFEDLIVCNFEKAAFFRVSQSQGELIYSQEDKCSAIYSSPLIQKKVNYLTGNTNRNEIVIEVAENQEESVDYNGSFMTESANEREPVKKSFISEEAEANRLKWAETKVNPFTEDVFSMGLAILQTVYQCSGPELKNLR